MENVKINQLIRDIKNKHENDDSNVYIDELCDYNDYLPNIDDINDATAPEEA